MIDRGPVTSVDARTEGPAIDRSPGGVARNTLLALVTNGASRLMTPALLIYAARTLGVHRYGELSFMLDFATLALALASLGSDHGFYALLLRIGATNQRLAIRSYPAMLGMLVALYGVGAAISLALLQLAPSRAPSFESAVLLTLYVATMNVGGLLDSLFRAVDRFLLASLRALAQQVLTLGFGLAALELAPGLPALAGALVVAALIADILGTALLRGALPELPRSSRRLWCPLLRRGRHLSRLYMLLDVYWRADVVLLGLIVGASTVARYSVAYRIVLLYLGFQSAVELATFGPMRRAAVRSIDEFAAAVAPLLGLVLLAASVVSIALLAFARPIVELLYSSQYASSAPLLAVMACALVFMSAQRVCNQALVAREDERRQAQAFTLVVLAGLIANGLLIPVLAAWGATVVMVVTEIALFAVYAARLSRLGGALSVIRSVALRGVASWGAGAGVATAVTLGGAPAPAAAAAGMAAFAFAAVALGAARREMLVLFASESESVS